MFFAIILFSIAIVEHQRGRNVSSQWLVYAGCIAFCFGAYKAWEGERTNNTALMAANASLNQQLASLVQPDLHLDIDNIGTGNLKPGNILGVGLMVTANLTNKGAPSVADGWTLEIKFADGRDFKGTPDYINPQKNISWDDPGKSYISSADDALYNLAATNPIQRGARVRGRLIFIVPFSIKDLIHRGNMFILRCQDIDGKVIEGSRTPDFIGDSTDKYPYFPGLPAVQVKSTPLKGDKPQ